MYQVASSSITKGLSPGLAIGAVIVGHLLVSVPAMLNGYVGCIYGINFPVLVRSTFGIYGACFAVLVRGVVACICMSSASHHRMITDQLRVWNSKLSAGQCVQTMLEGI
jgi:NCS1 family nucleobase:cation symporter-1